MNPEFFGELRWAALQFIALVLCVSLHEFGHAWAADRRGDPLPRAEGRVSLNPLAHIDPIGTLAIPALMIFLPVFFGGLPFALIGWGKPVRISLPNPKTRRADEILITLAGPGMNLLLALASALALGGLFAAAPSGMPVSVHEFFLLLVVLNSGLAVFNMIPIPPLDGSHLLRHAVGMSEETFAKIARNAWWIFLLAINLPPERPVFSMIFGPVVRAVATAFLALSEFIGGSLLS